MADITLFIYIFQIQKYNPISKGICERYTTKEKSNNVQKKKEKEDDIKKDKRRKQKMKQKEIKNASLC
jgi:hypothetical protein